MSISDIFTATILSTITSFAIFQYIHQAGENIHNSNQEYKLYGLSLNNSRLWINSNGKDKLSGHIRHSGVIKDVKTKADDLLVEYADSKLGIHFYTSGKASCHDIEWSSETLHLSHLQHCYHLGEAHWYGGFQHAWQPWPLEKIEMSETPFVSTDLFFHGQSIGGVHERLFFNSDGFGLYIPDAVPLYISINSSGDGRICLSSKHDGYPYLNTHRFPRLSYTICHADNVRTIRSHLLNTYYTKAENIPDETLFHKPIWCTWAQYNKDINDTAAVEYANTVIKHGFTYSQIEIDDDWTPFYGDLEFNKKFQEPAKTISKLNKLGFRVTLWVHPFMELNSSSFPEAASRGYLIRSRGDTVPALVRWWDGEMAGILDVTNPMAVDWFLKKLEKLQKNYGVSSFKFDAGESFFLPKNYATRNPLQSPEQFATLWATLAHRSDMSIRHQEVRIAYRTQHLPIFVRMFDRSSSWDDMAGIQTLIPTILTFGLLGYPFVLADMVGGNAYGDLVTFKGGAYPDRELFIRWMEINAFFPTIQYSIAPWIYDTEVIELCKRYTDLHAKYAPVMIDLAKESITTGDPIIRPIWWNSPRDETALTVDDEFLVGNSILVSPIIRKGHTSRNIYLPTGVWKDELNGGAQIGPKWLFNYKVGLSELPYFTALS